MSKEKVLRQKLERLTSLFLKQKSVLTELTSKSIFTVLISKADNEALKKEIKELKSMNKISLKDSKRIEPKKVVHEQESRPLVKASTLKTKKEPLEKLNLLGAFDELFETKRHLSSSTREINKSQNKLTKRKLSASKSSRNEPETSYAYQEVVRNKRERRELPAHTCNQCEKFYDSLMLPTAEKESLKNDCSRHRARYKIPSTPEHYWSLPSLSSPPLD